MINLIKICKHHGNLYEPDVIKSGKNASGAPRFKCRKCMKELHARHYELNKEKVLAKHAEYRKENPEKKRESHYKSWLKHKHKYHEREAARKLKWNIANKPYYAKAERNRIDKLTDSYVKKVICNRWDFKRGDVPPELIKVKRALLILKRNLKIRRRNE